MHGAKNIWRTTSSHEDAISAFLFIEFAYMAHDVFITMCHMLGLQVLTILTQCTKVNAIVIIIPKLEALGERRPPWPRQIITPIFPNVIMLSLGGERLTPKVLDHYLHHGLGMLLLLWCMFAHLLILEYQDHHQNLISSSLYYKGPLHKISPQSVHNVLSNVVHRQINRQTNQRYQKHNSFAKEVRGNCIF